MTMNGEFNREVSFEIVEPIGVLASHSTGWRKEINLVRWNGGQPKYDIRDWSPDHAHMSRGITLHEKEMRHIFDLLKQRRQRERYNRGQDHAAVTPEQASAEPSSVPAPASSQPPPLSDMPSDIPPDISECIGDFDSMEISENGEVL